MVSLFSTEKLYVIGALADKIAHQKNLLSGIIWLPARLSYKMYAFWLVVCFILLSKIHLLSSSMKLGPVHKSFNCSHYIL